VVVDQDVIEPQPFRCLGVVAHDRRVAADLGLRERNADFHRSLLLLNQAQLELGALIIRRAVSSVNDALICDRLLQRCYGQRTQNSECGSVACSLLSVLSSPSGKEACVHDPVIATVAVLLFLGLDIGFVVIALLWLSERRVLDDKTDQRNRKRPIRYR
jgi:hypothetical protein